MASALASPFVIRLYGIIEENAHGPPGIVMEYMEYGSVWTLMERVRTIPWALKFRIIHEVTVGMNWLHHLSTPILHLDLKTKNVLLDAELHIKVRICSCSYRGYAIAIDIINHISKEKMLPIANESY